MYNLTGFMARTGLANNNPREVAPLGELSVYASTFARDRRIYFTADQPLVTLFAFESYNEISVTERENANVPTAVQTVGRQIAQRLYTLADAGQLSINRELVEEVLLNEFGGIIRNVTVGEMVPDGNRWMPGYIIYEGTSASAPYQARFWFSDEVFRQQFEGYEINVVPMFDNIDALFGDLADVDAMIAAEQTQMAVAEKVRVLQDRDPFTDMVPSEYEWRQAGQPTIRRNITITVIVYGDAGLNPDRRRKAIADWILANSEYGEDAWREIMPDVFSPTEFIFVPSWNRFSIPSGTIEDWATGEYPQSVLSAGTYMPGGNAKNQVDFIKEFAKGVGYTPEWVEDKANLVHFVFKSIQVGIIGGYRNRDGVDQFINRWKDYIAVGTGTTDFERMSESTQQMVFLIVDMLRIAETMSITSTIPRQYMRLVRDDVLYLSVDYEKTQLLVVSRKSVAERFQYTSGSENVEQVGE